MNKLFTCIVGSLASIAILMGQTTKKDFSDVINNRTGLLDVAPVKTKQSKAGSFNLRFFQDSVLQEIFDTTWMLNGKVQYHYDASGNDTTELDFKRIMGNWINGNKHENSYDINGKPVQQIIYTWSLKLNQWIAESKYDLTYDSNENNIRKISSQWDPQTNQFVALQKNEFTYDTRGNVLTDTEFAWDGVNNQWDATSKTEYTYNARGDIILQINSTPDAITHEWGPYGKEENIYDENFRNTGSISYVWLKNNWVPSVKTDNTYLNETLSARIIQIWNSSSKWDTISEYTYGYDSNNNQSQLVYNVWRSNMRQWIASIRWSYYYSQYDVSSVLNNEENVMKVYPNPAEEFITFDFPHALGPIRAELFDVTGQRVVDQNLNGTQLNIRNLGSGSYLYRVTYNKKIYTGKVMIK